MKKISLSFTIVYLLFVISIYADTINEQSTKGDQSPAIQAGGNVHINYGITQEQFSKILKEQEKNIINKLKLSKTNDDTKQYLIKKLEKVQKKISTIKNSNGSLFEYFNFYIGSTWVYNISKKEYSVESKNKHHVEYSNNKFSHTVKHVEYDYSNEIGNVVIEQKGSNSLTGCFYKNVKKTNIFWYVFYRYRMYKACSYDEYENITNSLREGKLKKIKDNLEYVYPFNLGNTWSIDDILAKSVRNNTKKWRWHISNLVKDITMPAGTFHNCVEITYRTNPDYSRRYICKNIGLVMETYHYNGTPEDITMQLVDYKINAEKKSNKAYHNRP
jgi:hypothetical protein